MSVKTERKPGWWYPYIFVGGFGVIIVVNLIMAYFATSTFTGLETEKAYDKGLKYNQALAAAEAQRQLGWSVAAKVEDKAQMPNGGRLANVTVTYLGKDGQPLDGLEVDALFTRPLQKGVDQTLRLAPIGGGQYRAEVELPLRGQWDMALNANGPNANHQIKQRIDLH